MKTLGNFLLDSDDSERIERKFRMNRGQGNLAEWVIKKNLFREIYAQRKVVSIYFDDIELTSLRDNIDGNPYRDKFRIRWYDDNYNTAKIEIKHKRYIVGYKTTIDIAKNLQSKIEVIEYAQKWVDCNLNKKYFPVAQIEYQRRYYAKGSIRCTIDKKIQSGRYINGEVLTAAKEYEVVEFKYFKSDDSNFRSLYGEMSDIAIRATKSSKYSQALLPVG